MSFPAIRKASASLVGSNFSAFRGLRRLGRSFLLDADKAVPRWTDNLNDRALEQRPGHPHVVIFRDAIDHGIGFVNILPMVGTILVVQTRGVEKFNAIAFSDLLAGRGRFPSCEPERTAGCKKLARTFAHSPQNGAARTGRDL